MEGSSGRESYRNIPLHAASLRENAIAAADGWSHYQQWLHFGTRSPSVFGALYRHKHAITGLTKSTSLDGRRYNIACGQIDIGNAATQLTTEMEQGTLQANGRLEVEPTIDPAVIARAVIYMASLPLDANVQFMTVMATKMPYIGRG